MTKQLWALSPRWILNDDGYQVGISFDCPAHERRHRIQLSWTWRMGRSLDALTAQPEARSECGFCGRIADGRVSW